jgi:hypothetical protein
VTDPKREKEAEADEEAETEEDRRIGSGNAAILSVSEPIGEL